MAVMDLSAQRTALADLAREALTDSKVTVLERPAKSLTATPAVVIGQPTLTGFEVEPYVHLFDWPIAVIVSEGASGNLAHAQETLETLWPEVVVRINEALAVDQTLGGAVVAATINRAEFGEFAIAGIQYPAQTIYVYVYAD